jgi:hypothetical protein
VLTRIFGLKRDQVTSGWRKLNNEELADHPACLEGDEKCKQNFSWKPDRKRPYRRSRHIDVRTIFKWILGKETVDWIHLAQERDW